MKISENLRKLMDDIKITEAKLARQTGIPQPTLHRILSGATRSPRGESLSKLANFLSVTISQLIGDDPLPSNRLPGTHNPQVRSWKSIPLMTLDEVMAWPQLRDKLAEQNWAHWTTTDVQTSEATFAIHVNTDSLNPRFPNSTVLVVEPNLAPEDRDFVVIQTKGMRSATVKQLLLDGQDRYLKPLNPEFQTVMMGEEHVILGIILQARTDIRRRESVRVSESVS
ncbi:MAG: peptidase S24-like domain protein [Gammaproteobacteria bacterium]|jgi:SOS-response transcriptional repressor LexA|nr:peptidase S24-like domain protein [Gammaproteobacteria bacterium]